MCHEALISAVMLFSLTYCKRSKDRTVKKDVRKHETKYTTVFITRISTFFMDAHHTVQVGIYAISCINLETLPKILKIVKDCIFIVGKNLLDKKYVVCDSLQTIANCGNQI